VLISSGVATIAIWALGIQLSPMTAVGGPLVVATCTEFTSLIVLRYIEERRRGLEPREAIDVTASRTGRAFIVSAMTAISGVAVIAFSSLPLLRNFGIFVALKIAIALLAALVVLPPLIVWADQRGWVSKGMLDHEEPPFIEVPDHRSETSSTAG
jgi:predicted RND superfamily exporter protein